MIQFPNGYIIETGQDENAFYVYGELNDTGSVAKGFRLLVPNLSHSGWGQKNDLYCNLQAYLSRFDGTKRIQFRYRRDSNYRHILDRYDADTRKFSDFPFARKFRERIAARFRKEMENQELRREYLSVYIACPAKNFISGALNVHSEKAMRQFKMRVSEFFESEYIALKSAFDFPVEKMTAVELFAEFYGAVNSSLSAAEVDYRKIFTPNFSEIYCNEYSSQDHLAKDRKTQDASGRGYGMYGDGMYHNILSMRQLPSFDLTPFYGNIILESNVSNFSVTTNLKPLNKSKAIEKLEARQAAAQRDLEADPSAIAYRSEVDALGKTIYRMGAGEDIPFEAEYLIHVWNPDLDQLRQDTELLRLVATNLQCHMMMYDLTVQSEAEFLKTLPGNLYYKKWSPMFVLHRSFAAILPFSSTFVGCEQEFQALFHGDHNNLVCVNGFYGGTPQHAAVFGQTGSGKSVNILGELLQTFPYYHKLVIIEEGASYLMFTRIFGGEFIEIDLNNNMTLNYFDTCAAPLTANQIDFATSFATAMCGQSADDELIQDRTALLSHYIIRLYDTAWQEWWSGHTELRSKIARLALTVEWMLPHQIADVCALYQSNKGMDFNKKAALRDLIDGGYIQSRDAIAKIKYTTDAMDDLLIAKYGDARIGKNIRARINSLVDDARIGQIDRDDLETMTIRKAMDIITLDTRHRTLAPATEKQIELLREMEQRGQIDLQKTDLSSLPFKSADMLIKQNIGNPVSSDMPATPKQRSLLKLLIENNLVPRCSYPEWKSMTKIQAAERIKAVPGNVLQRIMRKIDADTPGHRSGPGCGPDM